MSSDTPPPGGDSQPPPYGSQPPPYGSQPPPYGSQPPPYGSGGAGDPGGAGGYGTPPPPPYGGPGGPGGPVPPGGPNPANNKATLALVLSGLGIPLSCCCFVFAAMGGVGFWLATQAEREGATNGHARIAKILAYVCFAIAAISLVVGIARGFNTFGNLN